MQNKVIKNYISEYKNDIAAIYNHYILHSTATYATTPMTPSEMDKYMLPAGNIYHSICLFIDDELIGYALNTPISSREAYRRTCEITIYLKPEFTGQGYANYLYDELEDRITKDNVIKVLTLRIDDKNTGSIKFFKHKGYTLTGKWRDFGEKFGKILSVDFMTKYL